jgi:cytoskeletal protein CcmA (bactofilin family)
MSIANFRAKIATIANDIENEGSSVAKKIESITTNFKSTPTIIARDLTISGDLVSLGVIEIEGRIKGSVRGNLVILRENGFVEGDIFADSLSIRGSFEGNINAQNINICSKAKVLGEIVYESLSVEDGACIDARFKKIS